MSSTVAIAALLAAGGAGAAIRAAVRQQVRSARTLEQLHFESERADAQRATRAATLIAAVDAYRPCLRIVREPAGAIAFYLNVAEDVDPFAGFYGDAPAVDEVIVAWLRWSPTRARGQAGWWLHLRDGSGGWAPYAIEATTRELQQLLDEDGDASSAWVAATALARERSRDAAVREAEIEVLERLATGQLRPPSSTSTSTRAWVGG